MIDISQVITCTIVILYNVQLYNATFVTRPNLWAARLWLDMNGIYIGLDIT